MAFPGIPQFQDGLMLQSGSQMQAFVHNTLSVDIGLKARQGGGQQFATLVDAVVCVVSRVTTTGDSIQLPPTNGRLGQGPYLGGLQVLIINPQANACQLFGNYFENSTIGGVAGSTGISIPAGGSVQLVCGAPGIWISIVGGGSGGVPFTGGSLTGGLGLTSALGLTATGNSQNTALLVTAQQVVVTTVTTTNVSGVRLPLLADLVSGALGPVWLKNKDPNNNLVVYPPVGGQIDALGVNQPLILFSLDGLELVPGASGQWWS